jgi:type I restriction enzyme S subunit
VIPVAEVKLGEVAEFIRGINFKPDDIVPVGTEGSVVCMRTKNVQDELDCGDIWAVPRKFVRHDDQMMMEGDILVSSANSWNLVGKCSWIPKLDWPSSFGGFVSVLRVNPTLAEPRFIYWWFASGRTQALLRSFGQKTTNISNLNIERCLNLKLLLPSLQEQRRIAVILDQADTLRAKRREALAQLDSLTQSIFIEMFGGDAGYPTVQLGSIASMKRGPFGGALKKEIFVPEGPMVYEQRNAIQDDCLTGRYFITETKFCEMEHFAVLPDDRGCKSDCVNTYF